MPSVDNECLSHLYYIGIATQISRTTAKMETMLSNNILAAASVEPADLIDDLRAVEHWSERIDVERLDAAFRAWAHNSRRAFRADLAIWLRWCRTNRLDPARAGASEVARFIRSLVAGEDRQGRPRAAATIKRYIVHVGRAYRLLRLVDPTDDELVAYELKAARKKVGSKQRQALGLRFKGDVVDLDGPEAALSLKTLLKACRRGSYGRLDALALRNIAMLRVAYDTGLRRSELVRVEVAHIEGPDSDGAGRLFIPFSKTDQEGEGDYAFLSPATMSALKDWLSEGRLKTGPVFCQIKTHFDGSIAMICKNALHPNSVGEIYKRLVRTAHERGLLGQMGEVELERVVKSISSHSIRVGVAQDNFAAEESLGAIMQAYRWKDPRTVLRYGEKLAVRGGASARMAKRFAQ